jgi:hypothetical protein
MWKTSEKLGLLSSNLHYSRVIRGVCGVHITYREGIYGYDVEQLHTFPDRAKHQEQHAGVTDTGTQTADCET